MPHINILLCNILISMIFIACTILYPIVSMAETGWIIALGLLVVLDGLILINLWRKRKLFNAVSSATQTPAIKLFLLSFIAYLSVLVYSMLNGWYQTDFYAMSQASFNFLIFLPLCALPLFFQKETDYLKHANFWLNIAGITMLILIFIIWAKHNFTTIRLTNFDIRATYPWLLITVILPSALLFNPLRFWMRFFLISLVVLSFIGIVMTNTRTYLFSALLGFGFIFWYFIWKTNYRSQAIKYMIVILGSTIVLLMVEPHLRSITYNGLNRLTFSYFNLKSDYIVEGHGSIDLFNSLDNFSNGRLENEWLSAINTWQSASLVEKFIGIGIGSQFTTQSGESQNYIHNILLYFLVYYGLIGVILCLFFYLQLIRTLWHYTISMQSPVMLGFLGLLIASFSFAQLFPVYNFTPYNLMLSIIISVIFAKRFLTD